jgi:uncharacterized protein (TIGR02444 family)
MSNMDQPLCFWDFSVRVYDQVGVADACLALQSQHGLDVNFLLYCCWTGVSRGKFRDAEFTAAVEFTETWSVNVVRQLREARTWMKTTGCASGYVPEAECMAARADVKAAELAAERLQQLGLESLSEPAAEKPLPADEQLSATLNNLNLYLAHRHLDRAQLSISDLATVVINAIPESDYDTIARLLTADS